MLTALADHVAQSTLFACLVALLILAFRNNRAAIRHGLWFTASLKFLVPFALLQALASEWNRPTPPVFTHMSQAMSDVSWHLAPIGGAVARTVQRAAPATNRLPAILVGLWLCGVLVQVLLWTREWLRIRALVRASTPLALDIPIPAFSSPVGLEPGVFGIFRPVLLLPEGLPDRLAPDQFETVLAHELWHVRRRDNLSAAIHMLVEALFWFHPLVWWIGARLVAERERACDEAVIQCTGHRQAYAEAILDVCRTYARSPLTAGIASSRLKRRIEAILRARPTRQLTPAKKLLLISFAVATLAAPLFFGLLNAPPLLAQLQSARTPSFEAASIRPNNSTSRDGLGYQFLPGGRLSIRHLPVRIIISLAYDLPLFMSPRLSGDSEWVRSENFDIEATAPLGLIPPGASSKERDDKIRLMLQNLLADRFKLVMRRETREMPVYTVVVGKLGPKMQKSRIEDRDCVTIMTTSNNTASCHSVTGGMGRGIHGKALSVADIANVAENWADRPIVDKTGLDGLFEVDTEGWAPMRPRIVPPGREPTAEDRAFADPMRPTLFQIFERLGLKMEAQKALVETYIIESIDHPSAN